MKTCKFVELTYIGSDMSCHFITRCTKRVLYGKRFLFPMYVDIEFSTDRTTLLAEAIKEAQEICEIDKDSSECHWAWYEVDELEDAILRLYPDRL